MTSPPIAPFAGTTVLVTGAATGLGYAIAEAFGCAGARIALNDLTAERAEGACAALGAGGIEAVPFPFDVRDAAATAAMVAAVVERLGPPLVAVANAGLYPNTPFLDLSEAEWDRVLDVNLKGAFLTCQATARAMVAAGRGGTIVAVSSGAANVGLRGWAHYCASKAGVVGLTRVMAAELGGHGIRVNAVLPGYVEVPEGGAHLDEAYKAAARAANQLGRPAAPADIANAVLLLCSPQAEFVTGATLAVDGGASAARVGPPYPTPEGDRAA